MTLTERLLALWDHLGIAAAHVATQMPAHVAGLVAQSPERIAGLLLSEPVGFDPYALRSVAARTVILAGDGGSSGTIADSAAKILPQARRVTLVGYVRPTWADHVRDNTDTVVRTLELLPGSADVAVRGPDSGTCAGITYSISGSGPVLILFPLFLSSAQWDAALPALTSRFTVIQLGGAYVGGAALLEDRARSPSYAGMVRHLHDRIGPGPGQSMLEVGCGSGALARMAAAREHCGVVTACDLNQYLLLEAEALVREQGLASRLIFRKADAEQLPFEDASFDHAYSVTVLEECDADRALREMWRVVKPGGRVGIIVRAIDCHHYWQADLPDAIRVKVAPLPGSVAPKGVADASLYQRMRDAGFDPVSGFPMHATFDHTTREYFDFMIGRVEARLEPDELEVFRGALQVSQAAGTLFGTIPHHCAIGIKG